MKRALSLCFVMLATIHILAHAAIPHHHHDGIPVVIAHLQHEGKMPNHDSGENWLLTTYKTRLGNDKQIIQSYNFFFSFDLLPCFLTLFLDNTITLLHDGVVLQFGHYPFFLFTYTDFIVCSSGLRAPPVC